MWSLVLGGWVYFIFTGGPSSSRQMSMWEAGFGGGISYLQVDIPSSSSSSWQMWGAEFGGDFMFTGGSPPPPPPPQMWSALITRTAGNVQRKSSSPSKSCPPP